MTVRRSRVLTGLGLVGLGILLYTTLLDDLPTAFHVAGDRPENLQEVFGKQTVGEILTITPSTANLTGIDLELAGKRGKRLSGTATVHVRHSLADQDDLRTATVDLSTFLRGAHTRFAFPPLAVSAGQTLYVFLEYPEGSPELPLLARVERPRADRDAWNDYANGRLVVSHQETNGDLAFRLLTKDRLPFGVQASAAAGVFGLALIARGLTPRVRAPVGLLVLAGGLPLIFALPLFKHPTFLGTGDWDMNTTIHAAAERALLREHQFPGWNPYLCGGTPLAAYPEAPVFSPFFATVLLAGPVVGFKINVLAHLLIGFAGMLVFLRRGVRASWMAAFLGAAIVLFSSFVALHLHEGHTRKVAIAWIPWVLFFFQRAALAGNVSAHHSESHVVPERERGDVPFGGLTIPSAHARDVQSEASALRTSRSVRQRGRPEHPAQDGEELPGNWQQLRYAAPAAAALALMFFDGSVYLTIYTATTVALLSIGYALQLRSWRPLVVGGATLVLAILLAGVRIVPSTLSQRAIPFSLQETRTPLPFRGIIDVFLDPNQSPDAQKFPGQAVAWSEYGAYVGIAPLALALLGLLTAGRRLWPWGAVGAFFFLGAFAPAVQRALAPFPLLGDLRNPQRMAVLVTVALALFAAIGLDRLRRWLGVSPPGGSAPKSTRIALGTLVALTIGHLIYVSVPALATTFSLPPSPTADRAFAQSWARNLPIGDADSMLYTMENTLQNRGSVNRCSIAGVYSATDLRLPPGSLRPGEAPNDYTNEPYAGEAFFLEGNGTAEVLEQTTSGALVRYTATTKAVLALNQNIHPGWTTLDPAADGRSRKPALAVRRLVGTLVSAGSGTRVFRYEPPGIATGLMLSALGLFLSAALWRSRRRTLPPS